MTRPARTRKKPRLGQGRDQRLRAEYPDQMGALDFQTDLTVHGRQVRFLNVSDEYTREACHVPVPVGHLRSVRTPAHIGMDNGSE